MTTKKLALLVITFVGVVPLAVTALAVWAVGAGPGLKQRYFGDGVVDNALVGQSESQIAKSYGTPHRDWPEYKALGITPYDPTETASAQPSVPIRTVIYHPRGLRHLEGGRLWVWYHLKGDEWICFRSCWIADGVHF